MKCADSLALRQWFNFLVLNIARARNTDRVLTSLTKRNGTCNENIHGLVVGSGG